MALGVMLALLVAGCGNQDDDASEPAEELTWDDLLPADWQPEKLLEDFNVEDVADEDPRAAELMDKLQALWQQAPVVPELDGRRVRLPGFVVPVDLQAEKINAFLLVPYFGACIHVPPPPANQTVYVQTREGRPYVGALFDTVWVEGTMQVEQFDSDLGNAGYRIEQARVTPYEIKE
ncbi:DUF3299 domain-containing protein [Thiorhodovibrio winogradskyi]|uniref:DUF3299 domain-containing protein n=2 Tax=Thiorhodovibrio TaxID=61593 RepID=UPI0031FBD160